MVTHVCKMRISMTSRSTDTAAIFCQQQSLALQQVVVCSTEGSFHNVFKPLEVYFKNEGEKLSIPSKGVLALLGYV